MKGTVVILKSDNTEKALLLCVFSKKEQALQNKVQELENLALACNMEGVLTVWQHLDRKNQKYYVGKGKLEEVRQMIIDQEIDVVICNDELSPSQLIAIEEVLECKVIDRTFLILEIFSKRAQTTEAKLQVKVARLAYQLPRLVGLHASLSRQSGGMNKGLGETKLELDRRKIRNQMDRANEQLQQLVLHRQTQRKKRQQNGCYTIALVGYTNAGKSSLMNVLLDKSHSPESKHVLQKDMLFATLETTTRQLRINNGLPFILTDTVGFVSNLPTHLIKAFRSTLEEVLEADLLLHVIDASDPNQDFHTQTTLSTLYQIGVQEVDMITVYNKIDQGCNLSLMPRREDVFVSCQTGEGIELLLEKIQKQMDLTLTELSLQLSFKQADVLAHFKANYIIIKEVVTQDGYDITVKLPIDHLPYYQKYINIKHLH